MINYKSKKNMRIIAVILLLVVSLPFLSFISTIKNRNNITLYIDDNFTKFNITPIKRKNKVYLPLIDIMTALNYEIDIEDDMLGFLNDDRTIKYKLGRSYGYVNNKFTHFAYPSISRNGVVYTPLESIEKMTSTYSKWTRDKRTLYLESPPKIKFIQSKDDFYISTYNKKHQILAKIIKDKLMISGYIDNGFSWTMDTINNGIKTNMARDFIINNSFESSTNIIKNNSYNHFIVNANRENSFFDHNTYINVIPKYDLEVFSTNALEHEKIYNTYIDNYVFANSKNYNRNLSLYNEHSLHHPKSFLSLDFIKDRDQLDEIKSLALYITRALDNDYDKAFAIHNWIVENLSYDYEKYYSKDWSGQDPYVALKEKRTLCEGFSFLNMALCRSINIPSKLVFGFAGNPNIATDELEHSRYGHAWNELFIDNRWIIVDTTWDTKSTYNEGMFLKNVNSFLHFDVSLKQISNTHLIELYPIY